MRKRILSLYMVLALCLMLLTMPVKALKGEDAPDTAELAGTVSLAVGERNSVLRPHSDKVASNVYWSVTGDSIRIVSQNNSSCVIEGVKAGDAYLYLNCALHYDKYDVFQHKYVDAIMNYDETWAVFVTSSSTGNGDSGTSFSWTLNNGILTINGTGNMPNWENENMSNNNAPWFKQRGEIKTVIISPGITSIGDWAFRLCRGVTSILMPSTLTSIGSHAFSYCEGLTGNFIIPDNVTAIDDMAFFFCSGLTSITIPSSVVAMGDSMFYGCSELIEINVEKGNP